MALSCCLLPWQWPPSWAVLTRRLLSPSSCVSVIWGAVVGTGTAASKAGRNVVQAAVPIANVASWKTAVGIAESAVRNRVKVVAALGGFPRSLRVFRATSGTKMTATERPEVESTPTGAALDKHKFSRTREKALANK